jgi:hypothetical protein
VKVQLGRPAMGRRQFKVGSKFQSRKKCPAVTQRKPWICFPSKAATPPAEQDGPPARLLRGRGRARAQTGTESLWQANGEGLGRLAAEPRSPRPETSGDTKPSTVAEMGRIPETPPGCRRGLGRQRRGGCCARRPERFSAKAQLF